MQTATNSSGELFTAGRVLNLVNQRDNLGKSMHIYNVHTQHMNNMFIFISCTALVFSKCNIMTTDQS